MHISCNNNINYLCFELGFWLHWPEKKQFEHILFRILICKGNIVEEEYTLIHVHNIYAIAIENLFLVYLVIGYEVWQRPPWPGGWWPSNLHHCQQPHRRLVDHCSRPHSPLPKVLQHTQMYDHCIVLIPRGLCLSFDNTSSYKYVTLEIN